MSVALSGRDGRQKAGCRAAMLVKAQQWTGACRDQVIVVKLGGSVIESPEATDRFLGDISLLGTTGLRPVLIHGAGMAITRAMNRAGLEPVFVNGRRYTDAPTLRIVQEVLTEVNEDLVRRLERWGVSACPLNPKTKVVLYGTKSKEDLGFVGEVRHVAETMVDHLCATQVIPVIPSLCVDGKQLLNVNADLAALAVARELNAEQLVYVSDVRGVCRDKSDPESVIGLLTTEEARHLIGTGAVTGGMIPKLQSCISILESGCVSRVDIIDGRLPHSLLLDVCAAQGRGTRVVCGPRQSGRYLERLAVGDVQLSSCMPA